MSFSAILLLSSMLFFSMFYFDNVNSRNFSVKEIQKYSKLEFVKDDLGFDVNKILGTEISVNRNSNLEVVFREKIPAGFDKAQRMDKFKDFIETSYSSINNAVIELDFDSTQGIIPIVFSNGLNYEYEFDAEETSVFFHAGNKDTNLSSMDLNLTVQGSSVEVTETLDTSNPDLTVNFNYVDENILNEKHETLQINSGFDNVITARFSENPKDIIEIHIGTFSNKVNALRVLNKTSSQQEIDFSFKGEMNPLNADVSFKAFLDAELNYNQTDLNSNSLLELKGFEKN